MDGILHPQPVCSGRCGLGLLYRPGPGHYRIHVRPTHATTAVDLQLYSPDGASLLAEASPRYFGEWTTLAWDAPADGTYALKLSHLNEAVAGDAVTYEIYILNGYAKYMPQIQR